MEGKRRKDSGSQSQPQGKGKSSAKLCTSCLHACKQGHAEVISCPKYRRKPEQRAFVFK